MSVPTLRFRIRKEKYTTPTLQGFITIYGETAPKFSTQIRIEHGQRWNQKKQRFDDNSKLSHSKNEIIADMISMVNTCFTLMSRPDLTGNIDQTIITARTLKEQFIRAWRKDFKIYTLLEIYNDFYNAQVIRLKTGEIEPKTLKKYFHCFEHIKDFLKATYKVQDISIFKVDAVLGYQFFDYLVGVVKMQKDTANRYLTYMRSALALAIKNRKIKDNPLNHTKPKITRKKPNKSMVTEAEQLKVYNMPHLTLTERHVADITTFLFYTTFDYCDLIEFEANKHIQLIGDIECIRKRRYKERKKDRPIVCTIPINNILKQLLKKYSKFPVYPDQTIRKIYKNLLSRLSIGNYTEITLKQIRKSGATYYANNGLPIETVSAGILGHEKIEITQKIYTKIQPNTVVNQTSHLLNRPEE